MKNPLRPKAINFGPATYNIRYTYKLMSEDNSQKLNGAINYQAGVIELDPAVSDQSMIGTIWHEAMHFLIKQYGQESAINPARIEDLVETLSTGIQTVIRLNPKLVRFMEDTL